MTLRRLFWCREWPFPETARGLERAAAFTTVFLSAEPNHKTIALAYGFQLMEQIPTGCMTGRWIRL